MQIRYIYVAIDSNMTIRNIYAVATACFAAAQRQTACRVDGQIDAIRIDHGAVMQPRDGGRARDGQGLGRRVVADLAVAENVVLVVFIHLRRADPYGVGGNSFIRPRHGELVAVNGFGAFNSFDTILAYVAVKNPTPHTNSMAACFPR